MKTKNNIKLGYYGDDFTGSTDVMEALTLNGIRTILFLEPPSQALIEESFPDIGAFGIAGISRSLNPKQMEDELRPVFHALKDSGAPICHYKTCSTFDSSPKIGSIGKAISIAWTIFGSSQRFIPMVIGAPSLKRYTVFGNHFATVNGETYRLDRHPIMSKHPMTPMNEADLLKHLKKQSDIASDLINIIELAEDTSRLKEIVAAKQQDKDLLLFDVLDDNQLEKIGELIIDESEKDGQLFTIGSSGIEYALTAAWKNRESGRHQAPTFTPVGSVDPMFVVSGSCSEVTKGQIEYVMENGFTGIRLPGEMLLDTYSGEQERNRLVEQINALLNTGKNVVLYSALGPEDPNIDKVRNKLVKAGRISTDTGHFLGEQLGRIAQEVIRNQGIKRLAVAGGDTSGYVLKQLGIYAMEMVMPITPGAPLCKAYSEHTMFDGIELCLKGGQIGSPDFFIKVKNGSGE